jgi:hypothetical protein
MLPPRVRSNFRFFVAADRNLAFTRVSRNLRIDGGLLSGETKRANGSWTSDSIDLNSKIGNRNGRFSFDGGRGFQMGIQEGWFKGNKESPG